MKGRAIELAHSVSVRVCDCGCRLVYLELEDRAGRKFALASIPFDAVLDLADGVLDEVDGEGGCDLEEMAAAGHA